MEPYADGDDRSRRDLHMDQPTTSIPKTIGTLNIIFGCLLILMAICSGLNLAMQPVMNSIMTAQRQQVEQAMEVERQAELRQLEQQEKATKDPKKKADLQAQQQNLKAQPLPKMPDIAKFTGDRRMLLYGLTDVVTGIVLNTLLVVSGIGLLYLKEWARRTALWVAGLKVVCLVATYGYFAMVIAPSMGQQFVGMFEDMAQGMPPGQGPGQAQVAQFGTILVTVIVIGSLVAILLGSVYPIVILSLLTRPRVRIACTAPGNTNDLFQDHVR
jgi:hypothetical protein